MRVRIDIETGVKPDIASRAYRVKVDISGVHEQHHGSNVVTKALVEASGQAALKIVQAAR